MGRKILTQSCKTVRNYISQQQPFYGPLSGTTRVSRYQKKHSPTHPPSRPSSNLYQLLPSTTIHSILPVQITCLAIFLHNLSPCPVFGTRLPKFLCSKFLAFGVIICSFLAMSRVTGSKSCKHDSLFSKKMYIFVLFKCHNVMR